MIQNNNHYYPDGKRFTVSDRIFVFGSNTAGIHGAGAALDAKKYFGAIQGQGVGRTGNAYALPTKDWYIQTLPLSVIKGNVTEFLKYQHCNPNLEFLITSTGTGLAGYKVEEIAPMFKGVKNSLMPESWKPYIEG